MSSSPFAFSSQRGNLFGSKSKGKDKAPPEDVTLVASKSQVITAIIPFGTKNAQAIRQHMHQNIVTETDPKGQRIFIFRQVNGWTNIHLESTEEKPKLTCDPITVLKIAWREFSACPQVGTLKIKWENSDATLAYDDIDGMETQFEPLPDESDEPSVPAKTDAEMIYDKVEQVEAKVDELNGKFTHVADSLDKIYSMIAPFTDPSASSLGEHDDGEEEGEGSAEKPVEETPHTTNTGNNRKRVRGRN